MHLPFVIISSNLSVIYSDVEKQTAMARKYINIYVLFKNNNKIFNFIKYVFYSSCKNHTLKDPTYISSNISAELHFNSCFFFS